MENLLLTIIIPTYKRNDYIIRAIESILKEKGNYEIIVVDDNDEDTVYRENNEKKLKKYIDEGKIQYIKHKNNMNGACARNSGIKVARGKYITFLDDDDEFINGRYSEFEKIVKKRSYDFICTGGIKKFGNGKMEKFIPNIEKSNKELIKDLLMQKSFIGTGSNMICRSEIVRQINGFDEKFRRHQDIEFLIRYLEKCNSKYCIKKLLIQKNAVATLNVPNIEGMIKVKKLFLKKFDYIIKKSEEKEQKKIYMENYKEVLKYCFINNDIDNRKQVIDFMKKNDIYDFKYCMNLRIRFFLRKIRPLREIVISLRKLKNNIHKEEIK